MVLYICFMMKSIIPTEIIIHNCGNEKELDKLKSEFYSFVAVFDEKEQSVNYGTARISNKKNSKKIKKIPSEKMFNGVVSIIH